jgi:hypothetical protein
VAADRAATDERFAAWDDALVAGGAVTLLVTIGNLAAFGAWVVRQSVDKET